MAVVNSLLAHPSEDEGLVGEDMTESLRAWLTRSPPAQSLVTRDELTAYSTLLSSLGCGTDSIYAECRLGEMRQLDLLVSFARRSSALPKLHELLVRRAADEPPSGTGAWTRTKKFVDRWVDPDDTLHNAVGTLWMEFDDVLRSPGLIKPSLSACVAPGYGIAWNAAFSRQSRMVEALKEVRRTLQLEVRDCSRFEQAINALPDSGRFIHLSVMTGRRKQDLKLYGVCPATRLPAYLQRMDLGHLAAPVSDFMQSCGILTTFGRDVYFDLNLSELINPSGAAFGIAFSQQNQVATAHTDVGRRALLARLVALGLCTNDQAQALSYWAERPGEGNLPVSGDLRAHRWLDLKATFDGQRWSVKAYLGFTQLRSPFLLQTRARRTHLK